MQQTRNQWPRIATSIISAAFVVVSPIIFVAVEWNAHDLAALIAALALLCVYLVYVVIAIPARWMLGTVLGRFWPWFWFLAGILIAAQRDASFSLDSRRFSPSVMTYTPVMLYAIVVINIFVSSRRIDRSKAVALSFPLRGGTFVVVQGGSGGFVNHHLASRAQRFALDIIKIPSNGPSWPGLGNASADDPSFGIPVHSALRGTVVDAGDGHSDNGLDRAQPYGNHVIVERYDRTRVVFAHLRQGSVAVSTGQQIEEGALLGSIGNSGNSTAPHLHIHAERDGIGVPMTFTGRVLVRSSVVRSA